MPVSSDDGRPQHVYRKCSRRVEHLEKAEVELHDFRREALASYELLGMRGGPVKRTKGCSDPVISPEAART